MPQVNYSQSDTRPHKPSVKPVAPNPPRPQKNTRYYTLEEAWLVFGIVVVLLVGMFLTITQQTKLAQINRILQEEKVELKGLEIDQEALRDQVIHLTQYDRIEKIAKEKGLTLNKSQVKELKKDESIESNHNPIFQPKEK